MFLVARPTTYPHTHPYAHPGTVYPHEHVQAPFHLPFDSVHAYEQHVARRRHDELVRQRALAAVARAQQRREYERRLAIQAAEEEIFLQRIARLRAQEKYRRELARQERLRQVEEARRAQRQRLISVMRVAMAQQAIYAALEQALTEDTDVAMTDDTPKVTQEQPVPAPQPVSLADALHSRAQTEQDPEVLLTLNGLLQVLASGSRSPSPHPASSGQPESNSTKDASAGSETTVEPNPVPVPTEIASIQESIPARPVSPAPSTSSHTTSIAALDAISTSLHNVVSDFVLPKVDFASPTSSTDSRPSSPSTHLAYTIANQPIHAYEAALGKLLDRLDAIESDGDEEIRAQRKRLVLQVEEKLRELDEAIEKQRREHEVTSLPSPLAPALELDTDKPEDAPAVEAPETSVESLSNPAVPAVDDEMENSTARSPGILARADFDSGVPETVEGRSSCPPPGQIEVDAAVHPAEAMALTSDQDAPADPDTASAQAHDNIQPDESAQDLVVDVSPTAPAPSHTSPESNEPDDPPSSSPITKSVLLGTKESQPDNTTQLEEEVSVTALLSPFPDGDAMSDLSSESDLGTELESADVARDVEHQADNLDVPPLPDDMEEDWLNVET